jgi:hypothetical protein
MLWILLLATTDLYLYPATPQITELANKMASEDFAEREEAYKEMQKSVGKDLKSIKHYAHWHADVEVRARCNELCEKHVDKFIASLGEKMPPIWAMPEDIRFADDQDLAEFYWRTTLADYQDVQREEMHWEWGVIQEATRRFMVHLFWKGKTEEARKIIQQMNEVEGYETRTASTSPDDGRGNHYYPYYDKTPRIKKK